MKHVDLGTFSYTELFFNAHAGVKVVMISLLLASVYSWAIIISKWVSIRNSKRQAEKFEKLFWSGKTIDYIQKKIIGKNDGHSTIFRVATKEWTYFEKNNLSNDTNLQERIVKVMQIAIDKVGEKMYKKLSSLATIGSVSPFVGLFGTVWGIMSSFQSIAATRNTDISVVAPGIAEALFATALGLFAAIPAVMAYNRFSSEIANVIARYENFASEFVTIISRMLDEKNVAAKNYKGLNPGIQHKGESKTDAYYGNNHNKIINQYHKINNKVDYEELNEQDGWDIDTEIEIGKSEQKEKTAQYANKNDNDENSEKINKKYNIFSARKKTNTKIPSEINREINSEINREINLQKNQSRKTGRQIVSSLSSSALSSKTVQYSRWGSKK